MIIDGQFPFPVVDFLFFFISICPSLSDFVLCHISFLPRDRLVKLYEAPSPCSRPSAGNSFLLVCSGFSPRLHEGFVCQASPRIFSPTPEACEAFSVLPPATFFLNYKTLLSVRCSDGPHPCRGPQWSYRPVSMRCYLFLSGPFVGGYYPELGAAEATPVWTLVRQGRFFPSCLQGH